MLLLLLLMLASEADYTQMLKSTAEIATDRQTHMQTDGRPDTGHTDMLKETDR